MNFYLLLYIFSVLACLSGGISVYKIYPNRFGFFFQLFTIFTSAWFITFFLFFSGIQEIHILLYLSKACFSVGVLATYSLMFSIKFFNSTKKTLSWIKKIIFYGFYIGIPIFYIFTDNIIRGLEFSKPEGVYREVLGEYYIIHILLQSGFIFGFILFALRKVKQQIYINRLRLKYILFSSYIFVSSLLVLQLFLPLLGIRIFEKELVLIFVAFILSIVYIVKRYYFTNLGYSIGKFVMRISALFVAGLMVYSIDTYYGDINNGFWGGNDINSIFNVILGIIFYIFISSFLSRKFLNNFVKQELHDEIKKLEQSISFITNFDDLNKFLSPKIQHIFKANFCEISLYEKNQEKTELQKFFEKSPQDKVFINDIVFIEEKKNKFDKNILLQQLDKKIFLVFPIYEMDGSSIGSFHLGIKNFGDFYDIDEINILKHFTLFLEHHLKYIKTYAQLQDFNVKLDKKVDEKTIEYNNLINKQKEFISLISHEIKSPLGAAIFQSDSILDDMMVGNLSQEELKSEVEVLNNILIRIGELSTKLFAVQYYDTHNVTLYKEPVSIKDLLMQEIYIYSHTNPNTEFIHEIEENIGFVHLDKIQFLQVTQNIIGNAIKFIPKKGGKIYIHAYKDEKNFYLSIEDNGNGFTGIEIEKIFDKYSTSGGNNIGLGMGLYLCKKIIQMHEGEISSGISEKFGGAKFSLSIPIH